MHYIQRKIFNQLRYARSLNYSGMRPEGIESNHFAYHLDKMIADGLIEKRDRRYLLTSQGMSLADRLNHTTTDIKMQPHIVVAPYITNTKGQDLLYRHNFQPYLDLLGPPQGRLEYDDDSALAAARRETHEKTGLDIPSLKHRGIVYVTANIKEVRISKILVHVFSGQVSGAPDLSPATIKGQAVWGDARKFNPKECMPGYKRIRELLIAYPDNLFFEEITVKMELQSH